MYPLDFSIEERHNFSKNITLQHQTYPVLINPTGTYACVCIGIGSLYQRTLSSNFKKTFKLYSTDSYWLESHRLKNPTTLTMDQIIDDIFNTIEQLNLKKPLLLAHSCYGIVAIEAAKRKNANLSGVLAINSAPAWNDDVLKFTHDYFNQYASPERKENHQLRKQHFEKIKTPNESEVSLNTYESDSARYWGNFNVTRTFLEKLWKDLAIDNDIINHFFCTLLPQHDLSKNMEQVTVPVLVTSGEFDFDSLPHELWKNFPKPKHFTLVDCGPVGHWPNLEAPELFDRLVLQWAQENKLIE